MRYVTPCLLLLPLMLDISNAFSIQHRAALSHASSKWTPAVTRHRLPLSSQSLIFKHSSTQLTSTSPSSDDNTSSSEDRPADETEENTGLLKRLGSYFKGGKSDDGLTTRQRLTKMGLTTVLSYGWISNTNAMILVAAAWYTFCAKTGMSPLYPGQWKNFLGVYAGFYVISNFLRPIRVTLAVAIGPYFDRFINWIQQKTKLPRAAAITVTVLLVNLGGTLLLMVGGISAASLLSGVPIFAPKA